MTCVAVYMLLMSFAQRGIDRLRNHHEHLQMRDPDGELEVSEGFDEGLSPARCVTMRALKRLGLG